MMMINLQQIKNYNRKQITTDNKFTTEDENPQIKLGDRIPENEKNEIDNKETHCDNVTESKFTTDGKFTTDQKFTTESKFTTDAKFTTDNKFTTEQKFTTENKFTTDSKFTTDDKKFTTEDENPQTKLGDKIPETKKNEIKEKK